MTTPKIAVLATLDSKRAEALYLCRAIRDAGGAPLLIDLSLKRHDFAGADITAQQVAAAGGTSPASLEALERSAAAESQIVGGTKILRELQSTDKISAAIGVGGANGCTLACGMMRALPALFPKVMVSPVAATAAVEWYVAESNIAMFPTIGDISLNRITETVMNQAAQAVTAMADGASARKNGASRPLVGVSSFGGTQPAVNRITERLQIAGSEVIHFHASGPGGKALESLARRGELAGVIDLTTSELADLLGGGVYQPGPDRLTGAGAVGIPQVIVPGALDHTNFWVGQVPAQYRNRDFYQYNVEILLMRTTAEEYERLAVFMAERLAAAAGPYGVLIPKRGFSAHTMRTMHDLDGNIRGPWLQPEVDAVLTEALKRLLPPGKVTTFDLHINDQEFADICVDKFLELTTI